MFPYQEGVRNGDSVGLRAARVLGLAGGFILGGVLITQSAFANMTITAPGVDMTTMGTYAGTILTALAGIWLVRKFVKTTNRS